MPEVQLQRLWPGGPAIGTFTARHGPDDQVLGRFTLRVENSAAIPKLLDEGVRRLDLIYAAALDAGQLRPDPTLDRRRRRRRSRRSPEEPTDRDRPDARRPRPCRPAQTTTFSVQVETPDAAAVSRAELGVSRVRGVTSAITTSLALGGTSVMRVTFMGDPAAFQAALQAQGWQVSGSGHDLAHLEGRRRLSWPRSRCRLPGRWPMPKRISSSPRPTAPPSTI